MKKIVLTLGLVSGLLLSANAQFLEGIGNKIKDKAKGRLNRGIDKTIDKGLDKTEEGVKNSVKKGTKGEEGDEEAVSGSSSGSRSKGIKTYSKFDFVPGEKILYSEDFASDAIGELPVSWNASGTGEVVTIDGQEGKWLQLFGNTNYLSGNKKALGENFTIEFDMIYRFSSKTSYVMPNIEFGLFSSGNKDNTDNSFLKDHRGINAVEVVFHPYGANSSAQLKSYKDRGQTFTSDKLILSRFPSYFNKVVHYSIQVQKQRLRLWMNEEKIFDIPRAVNTSTPLNQLFFFLEGSNYSDEEVSVYVSNLKTATGIPDTRSKLITEGKFSTTGILFDSGSDVIKPQSAGVLKEIAQTLKENADVKVKIIGHTDSDGNDKSNLELSKKRGAAVKAALEKDYGIEGNRMEADGKGETQPVGDNKTKEGKALNRRVEFIKL